MEIRAYEEADREQAWGLRRLAFAGPREIPRELGTPEWQAIVAEEKGNLVGHLRIHPFGQYFGGKSVPSGGIASVAVDPSARGTGVASGILTAALERMRADGQPISALFAAAPPLYRAFGYEQVGATQRFALPIERFGSGRFATTTGFSATLPPVSLRSGSRADFKAIQRLYQEISHNEQGMLDRAGGMVGWSAQLDGNVFDQAHSITLAEDAYGLRGVLVVVRSEVETTLRVRNVFASDAVAAAALFDVIGSWVGQITTVSLRVGQPSLLSLLLAWDHHIRLDSFPYMLRVVDLPEAIASRGWPTARQLRPTTVDVEVVDKRAPWNEGCWRVTIDDGVHVARGNRADVRLSARGLSAWYAGAASLASLKRVGLADGDSASIEKASVLDTLTAVPGPVWISDDF